VHANKHAVPKESVAILTPLICHALWTDGRNGRMIK
jgi:hypothetical protein